MIRKGRGSGTRILALLIFSASLFFLFMMSGIYHGLRPGPWRTFFRRLDYAGIWLLIAGSATSVHHITLKGAWHLALTALFWCVGLILLVVVDSFFARLPYWSIVSAYVGFSCLGVVSLSRIASSHGWKEPALLLWGAGAYVCGALIDNFGGPVLFNGYFGPHEMFHIMVIAGAVMHWCFIYQRADRPLPASGGLFGQVGLPLPPGAVPD